MTADIKPVALAASSVAAFTEAMRGPKGTLDAWLEDNNEAEVRAHVEAYAEQAIDSLRAEVAFYRRRCDALQAMQIRMRDPERQMVCDVLANGQDREAAGVGSYAAQPRGSDNDR